MRAKRANAFKKYLLRIMGTRWDVQSHEDKYSLGIPDLSFAMGGVSGWIELKQIEIYKTLTMKPSKYTAPQINWLNRRNRHGGSCFVFVKVDSDYYLFTADKARAIADGQTHMWYIDNCRRYWENSIVVEELVEELLRKTI